MSDNDNHTKDRSQWAGAKLYLGGEEISDIKGIEFTGNENTLVQNKTKDAGSPEGIIYFEED